MNTQTEKRTVIATKKSKALIPLENELRKIEINLEEGVNVVVTGKKADEILQTILFNVRRLEVGTNHQESKVMRALENRLEPGENNPVASKLIEVGHEIEAMGKRWIAAGRKAQALDQKAS